MGHDKLRKFAENETFACLLQPSAQELLADGYFHLRDHAVKGRWSAFFAGLPSGSSLSSASRGGELPPETSGCAGPLPLPPEAGPSLLRSRGWLRFPEAVAAPGPQNKSRDRDIILELGCGKGEYTIALAERHPERNYIGVDIKGARLWKGAKYATEHALPNVAFLRTRVEFISAFFAPGEVSEVWLTFSDPQYRSENSRLCSPLFLERYRGFLKPGGVVHLKTDSRFLHEYARAVCAVNGLRVLACTTDLYQMPDCEPAGSSSQETSFGPHRCASLAVPPLNVPRMAVFPGRTAGPASSQPALPSEVKEVQTFYERLFLEQRYPITYLSFVIDHDGPYVSPRDPEDFDSKAWRAAEGPRLLFGHDSAETRRQKLHSAADIPPDDQAH